MRGPDGLLETGLSLGFAGSLRVGVSLLATRLIARQARLIRLPVYIRNRRLIRFGPRFTSGVGLRIEAFGPRSGPVLIDIGPDVQVNDYVHIAAAGSVRIGARVLIASKVFVSDHDHGRYSGEEPHDAPHVPPARRPLATAPVSIEDDVWLGEFVCVLPGVTVGRGAVVGAHSVVTRDVPPETIAVGSPARVVKRWDASAARWERV